MFTSKREKRAESQIVALVELDMQKMRMDIVLSPEAIRERLRELEHPSGTITPGRPARAIVNSCLRLSVQKDFER